MRVGPPRTRFVFRDGRELLVCACRRLLHVAPWQWLPWGPEKAPSVLCAGCGRRNVP